MRGVVAAGHPVTAEAGAEGLRAGGNAVDAALAAMFASFVAEPMLTGLGAGGYMLVAPPGAEPVLLDFFVEAPGRGLAPGAPHAPLRSVEVDFGDAVQVFNIGAAAAGPYGTLSGAWTAAERFGRLPLAELVAPAVGAGPRRGRGQRAAGLPVRDPAPDLRGDAGGARAVHARRTPAAGRRAAPRSRARRRARTARRRGSGAVLHRRDRRGGLRVGRRPRRPAHARRPRGLRHGGAHAGARRRTAAGRWSRTRRRAPAGSCSRTRWRGSTARRRRRRSPRSWRAMAAAQAERTPEFLAGSDRVLERFGERLGATTHISAVDVDGWACAVTCTNGEGCGEVVPGHRHPPQQHDGRAGPLPVRLPRPPAGPPAAVDDGADDGARGDGAPRLVLGSAGSNRIRSAILQVVIGVLDRGLDVQAAIDAPRVHLEGDVTYVEPGVDVDRAGG